MTQDVSQMTKSQAFMELYRLGRLSPDAKGAVEAAKKRGLLDKFLAKMDKSEISPQQERTPGFFGTIKPTPEQIRGDKKAASELVRPILSGVAGTGGAIVGAGGGLFGGGPVGSAMGTVAGGALGYGIGEELADQFDEFLGLSKRKPLKEELLETGRDIRFGATAEMEGQSFIPALMLGKAGLQLAGKGTEFVARKIPGGETIIEAVKDVAGGIPLSAEKIAEKAKKILAANTKNGPIIARNIDEARALESKIPGLKFSLGQLTDDPGIIKLERSTAMEPGKFAGQKLDQISENTKAIRTFINKTKGKEGLSEVIDPLTQQAKAAETGITAAQKGLERESVALGRGAGAIESGQKIRGAAVAGKTAAKKEGKILFEDVPEFEIDANPIITKIDNLSKPLDQFENVAENVPAFFERAKKILEKAGGKTTPLGLQGLRREATKVLRKSQNPMEPNEIMASRISGLIGEIDDVLKSASETTAKSAVETAAAGKLKTAQQFWKKEVIEKFKHGTVGDILKKTGGKYRVSNSQIASRFFKPGPTGAESAQEFLNAIGKDKNAKQALEDFVKQDFLTAAMNPVTGDVTESGLKRWKAKHRWALGRLGLTDKFKTIENAGKQLDDAIEFKAQFDKAAASKLLNADADTAIKAAFATGPKGKTADELLKKMGGDKRAIAGLQNAIIDHVTSIPGLDDAVREFRTVAGLRNIIRDFNPVIDKVFKDSPEKIDALKAVRRSFEIMGRTAKAPIGGGSDTYQNIVTGMAKRFGMSGGRLLNFTKAVLSPIKNMSDKQVNAILERSLLDPDFAFTLLSAAKGMPVDAVGRRLKGHLLSLGIRQAKTKENNK